MIKLPHLHKKPGAPPGEAIFVGQQKDEPFGVRRIDFNKAELTRVESADVEEVANPPAPDRVSWLHVQGLHEAEKVAALGERFGLHPLVVEDILNTAHSPKVEELDGCVFVIVPFLSERGGELVADHFCLVLAEGVVLSFTDSPQEFLEPIVERLDAGRPRIRGSGADYLAWALLDAVVDHALVALDKMDERLADIELRIEGREAVAAAEVFRAKRQTGEFYRRMRRLREIAIHLGRSDSPLFSESTRPFLRDLYDHSLRAVEATEDLREMAANLRDYHLTEVSNRMNEVMKVLTCVATIFMPLSFLAGIYGMNFEWIPELSVRWGYPALWGVFLIVGCGLLWMFRRKRWL